MASCTSPWGTRRTTTTRPPSGNTLDTVNYRAQYQQARAQGQLPWFCHSEGLGGHMDHHAEGEDGLANDYYRGQVKGDLTDSECSQLADQFDQIIPGLRRFKTRGDAKRAGAVQAVQFVVGLGTHDSVPGYTRVGLPPGAPMFLQYDGSADTAPLGGLSWFTIGAGNRPPEGFPGKNDWWHTHSTLCYGQKDGSIQVLGNEISDEECRAKGGGNIRLPGIFMAHAWIVPGYEYPYDVFSGAFMCLDGDGIPPRQGDPCYDDRTNPEHGGHGTTTTTRSPGGTTTRPAGTTTTTHGEHAH